MGRSVAGVALLLLVVLAAQRNWQEASAALRRIEAQSVAASLVLALAGLFASAVTWWVVLRGLGVHSLRLPGAARVYLLGQLGKYAPGSVWAFVAQMELANRVGVARTTCVAAGVFAVLVNFVVGAALGLPAIALLPIDPVLSWLAVGLIAAAFVALLVRPIRLRLRALLPDRLAGHRLRPTRRALLLAAPWSVVSFAMYGSALAVILVDLGVGVQHALWMGATAVPLAMTVGFLVVVAPSGIGVREAVLVAALAGTLSVAHALAAALVFRLVLTVADVGAAVIVLPLGRMSRSGTTSALQATGPVHGSVGAAGSQGVARTRRRV